MRISPFVVLIAATTGVASMPAAAAADGTYEPNETAAMVVAPITAPALDAALETPQDTDWYLLHPQGIRQIGVQATLMTACAKSYGRISIDLHDADAPGRLAFAAMALGNDIFNSGTPRLSATTTFTSQVGHRYLLHVTQSGCAGGAYSLSLAPTGALGTRLAPADACKAANATATRARVKLKRLRGARRRARGARRRQLGVKIQLQAQQVAQTRADATAACARPPLVGYPWD